MAALTRNGDFAWWAAFYNVAPCLSRPPVPYRPPCFGADKPSGPCRRDVLARRSASSARSCRASASFWRAARRQYLCRNQVAQPPATTPAIATAMMTTNSGSVIASDGSTELIGSNDTVTRCRLATAKTIKIRPSGISTTAVKNLRMTPLTLPEIGGRPQRSLPGYGQAAPDLKRLGAGIRGCVAPVQPFTHFLARLEERDALLIDRHMRAGARIAAGTGGTMFHRKGAEAAQFDPVAACQRGDDLVEDRVHNVLDVPLIEMRVVLGDTLDEFGFDHRDWHPGTRGSPFP